MKENAFYFIAGSQHLYGPETLRIVDENSRMIAAYIDGHSENPCLILYKGIATTPEEITECLGRTTTKPARASFFDAHLLPRQNVDRRAFQSE